MIYSYSTLEDWSTTYFDNHPHHDPRADSLTAGQGRIHFLQMEEVKDDGTFGIRNFYSVVAWVAPNDDLHYCRMHTARQQLLQSRPMGDEEAVKAKHADDAHTLIRDWLMGQGLKRHPGFPGFPTDRQLLTGRAGFLKYDQVTGWSRRDEAAV